MPNPSNRTKKSALWRHSRGSGEDEGQRCGVNSLSAFKREKESQLMPEYLESWKDICGPMALQRKQAEKQRLLPGGPEMTAWLQLGLHEDCCLLWKEAEFLHRQLQWGYQQEALSLTSSLRDIKRKHLIRVQELELELSAMERERDHAVRQNAGILAEQQALLQENRSLVQVLHQARETLELQETRLALCPEKTFGTGRGGWT